MILVTGSTGLLGSHLLMELVARNERVRAIYRTEEKRNSVKNTFKYYYANPDNLFNKIEWVKGDVLDIQSLEDALTGITQVYHCAAAVTFLAKDHDYMNQVNVEGTANLLNLCVDKGNVRYCHVSSVAAIGRDGSEQVIKEENEWKESQHNSAYAVSKQNAEVEVWRAIEEGLDAFMVNPSLIIGPGDWNASSGTMFKRTWDGLPFYTRGGNCFVDVRDVVNAMVTLMGSGVTKERFIVGAENRTYKDVFDRIAKAMGKKPPKLEANQLLIGLAWRVEVLLSAITGKRPFITREIANHSLQLNRYDNSKLLRRIPEFTYRDLNETLEFVANEFVKDKQLKGHV